MNCPNCHDPNFKSGRPCIRCGSHGIRVGPPQKTREQIEENAKRRGFTGLEPFKRKRR